MKFIDTSELINLSHSTRTAEILKINNPRRYLLTDAHLGKDRFPCSHLHRHPEVYLNSSKNLMHHIGKHSLLLYEVVVHLLLCIMGSAEQD